MSGVLPKLNMSNEIVFGTVFVMLFFLLQNMIPNPTIVFCVVIVLLLVRLILDEIWTLLQIIKSVFVSTPDLKSKYGDWAVVTGCTDGIGKAYTFELAKRGLNIVLISRNPAKLNDVATELTRKYPIQTKIIVADFSEGEKVYPSIKEQLQGIEVAILVNNVGIATYYPMYFGEIPEKEIWDMINVNLGAMTQMTRIILPGMAARKRGAIVNMSSGSKLVPLPLMNMYAASKIFIDYYSEALRNEYKKKGLTIQTLSPYFVSTKIIEFSQLLSHVNVFVPSPHRFASHAIKTLGVIDNTTGYWPHRIQYALILLCPIWVRTYFGGLIYRRLRNNYLKENPKGLVSVR